MNYKVYQGTKLKQTVTSKTAVMNGLQPNQTYEFGVEADDVNNLLLGVTQPFSITGTNTTNQCDYANSLINGYNVSSLASKLGTQFTVSFDWSVSGSSPSGSFSAQWDNFPWNGGGNVTQVSSSNTSGHISNTINVSADSNNVATLLGLRLDNFVGTITISNLRLKKGSAATTSLTTRGIRFNIPKTLTVGSTITLRYEEYPLGIVQIGNEPSGYFGGGNKQNLSAKVISTANGSSVVEVAGNVIEVGNKNLIVRTGEIVNNILSSNGGKLQEFNQGSIMYDKIAVTAGEKLTFHQEQPVDSSYCFRYNWYDADGTYLSRTARPEEAIFTDTVPKNAAALWVSYSNVGRVKLERGDISTPYASFVDGDTFTAQPDGAYALFSEYKALYYG